MIKNKWNKQKSLKCLVRNFQQKWMKMHESCDLIGKRKGKRDLLMLEDKNPWEICGRKRQKRLRLDRSKKSSEKSVWKVLERMKNTKENSNCSNFNRSKLSFDWSSINWAPIEPGRFKPNFILQFRSIEQQLRLTENLEKLDFWKTKQFYAETTQNTIFHGWNVWVWV